MTTVILAGPVTVFFPKGGTVLRTCWMCCSLKIDVVLKKLNLKGAKLMKMFTKSLFSLGLSLALVGCGSSSLGVKGHSSDSYPGAQVRGRSAQQVRTYPQGMDVSSMTPYELSKCAETSPQVGREQRYFFDFNQSQVHAGYRRGLRKLGFYLVSHPGAHIRLEGNADDRGSREYNIALGDRRARAVARFLRQQGVASTQMRLVSYGAERPVVTGRNQHARQCNRRVDLIWK